LRDGDLGNSIDRRRRERVITIDESHNTDLSKTSRNLGEALLRRAVRAPH
jgi:hypothetical protein